MRHLYREHFSELEKLDVLATITDLSACPEKSCPGWRGKNFASLVEHLCTQVLQNFKYLFNGCTTKMFET